VSISNNTFANGGVATSGYLNGEAVLWGEVRNAREAARVSLIRSSQQSLHRFHNYLLGTGVVA
jgi:hypothetical protein